MPRATNKLIKEKKWEVLGLLGTLYTAYEITEAEYDREVAFLDTGRPTLARLSKKANDLYDRLDTLDEVQRLRRIEPEAEDGTAMNELYRWLTYRARREIVVDVIEFLDRIATSLPTRLKESLDRFRAIKVRLAFICRFIKVSDPRVWITKFIYSDYFVLTRSRNIRTELSRAAQTCQEQMNVVDSYRLERIEILRVAIMSYAPTGGCYVETPQWIAIKRATVNIKNLDDSCFENAVLASIHRKDINRHKCNEISQYRRWKYSPIRYNPAALDFDNIAFPVACSADVLDRFEHQNRDISVNIFGVEGESIYPLHQSSNPGRKHKVNLMLIEDENGNNHYITIMSLSRLLKTTLDKNVDARTYYCDTCLSRFKSEAKLEAHVASDRCIDWRKSKGVTAKPETFIKFDLQHMRKTVWLPVVIYCKIECTPVSMTEFTAKREVSAVTIIIKKGSSSEMLHFKSSDPVDELFKCLEEKAKELIDVLFTNIPMRELSFLQKSTYKSTKNCYLCHERFSNSNFKVRDHDHQTGDFIGAACRNCNLHRRISKQTKVAIVVDDMSSTGSFIFRKLASQGDSKRIEILSKNFDQYMSLQWGLYKFIDASHFMDFRVETVSDLCSKFEQFRTLSHRVYGLDPVHYVSAPGLSWDAMLRFTRARIELISDVSQYEFIESAIRGGFATMPCRYAAADGKQSHIMLFDANNLYGYCLSQPIPVGDYRWETEWNPEEGRSCFLEVDLGYPERLHNSHSDFPLIVNKTVIKPQWLSEYQKQLLTASGEELDKTPKLTATFGFQSKYVIAEPLLKYLMSSGIYVARIHRVLSFAVAPVMRPYIELNTEMRRKAANKFEGDFYKLMNNSIYGKCIESCRGRSSIKIANSEKLFLKYAASPLIKATSPISERSVAFEFYNKHVKLDKPVAIGAFVLDAAKLHNYEFFYDTVRKQWGTAKLLFHDTDSFCLYLESNNIASDLVNIAGSLDMGGSERMTPGKYKNELPHDTILEYVGLRAKVYSFRTAESERSKLSGTATEDIQFDDYKRCLLSGTSHSVLSSGKRRVDHEVFDIVSRRIALNCFDSKRFILEDGINSKPFLC